jgi:hypothetical protein
MSKKRGISTSKLAIKEGQKCSKMILFSNMRDIDRKILPGLGSSDFLNFWPSVMVTSIHIL